MSLLPSCSFRHRSEADLLLSASSGLAHSGLWAWRPIRRHRCRRTSGQPNAAPLNFVWTLLAAFLVMFMQAGFALVATGLCRAKSAAHTMSMNFMIYALGVLGFWFCGFAFMFGGSGAAAAAFDAHPTLGASIAHLDAEWTIRLGGHAWGVLGHRGFLFSPKTLGAGRGLPVRLPDRVHEHHRDRADRSDGRALELQELHALRVLGRDDRLRGLRQLGVGRRLALAVGRVRRTGTRARRFRGQFGRAHDRRRSSARSARRCLARGWASSSRTAPRGRFPGTTCPTSSWARSSWRSAGSGSIPARRWRARTSTSPPSRSTRCWPRPPGRASRRWACISASASRTLR